MTENNQPIDSETTEIAGPSWDEMRAEGLMVVDHEYDKLAVYVGGDEGSVVVMSQDFADKQLQFLIVPCANVRKLIYALEQALPDAEEDERAFNLKCEHAERDYDAAVARGEIQEG
ncbi:hypothetical protein G7048_15575 [Diaphorobacter sp. HDW4B]|uniref:hypothetical protein n=1 Tax=Diaphorobacter sp. HDW4B TaxID=2714925 RepID=UPI00140CF6CB|nr:hypothetical protein [Diaphorobacter sp. HDW4B]QIL69582.1 hypothetical protein G7048_03850 [Diaphorobacter sp. HDW4B]QIL71647.1 hypothetical protein G7048_15575 [Diaphorobacter sp. HDW4B]